MKESKIQWTDFTWNPWHGCHKVSDGCKFCYMFREKNRWKQDANNVVRSEDSTFNKPLLIKHPNKVFTCSWSDFFIEEADEWRDKAWEIIKNTPHLTYQILTKRPHRIAECLPEDWGEGYPNVWLGVSIENYTIASERIKYLEHIAAKVKFLSCEPLLSDPGLDTLNLTQRWSSFIDWVIIGGESGNTNGPYKYRPCNLAWIVRVMLICQAFQIPVFVKQLGTYLAKELKLKDRHGGNADEWPEVLKTQEWPDYYLSKNIQKNEEDN